MARDVESLVLQMSADLRRFDKSMAAMRQTADRRLTEVERRAVQSDKRLSQIMGRAGDNMVGSLKSSLASLAPTLAAAFSAQQVIRYADSYTNLQNQLRSTGLAGQDLKRVEDALFATANRNGVQIDATAQLYTRAALSRKALGASEEQLLTLVSGTTAALRVQGVSAEQASGPLLQLGQALGGGKIQAEEFNSLIDGLPVLLQAAANGSTKFGGDIGKLRAAVKEGEVSSKEFFAALLAGFPALEAQAASSTQTVGQALQNLNNQLGRLVGQTDTSLSATARMAQAINFLADNLDTVTQVVGVLAAIMGTRFVLAMTAGSGAMIAQTVAAARLTAFQVAMTASMTGTTRAALLGTTAMRGFTAAIAANPVGALIVAITALAAGVYLLNQRFSQAAVAARELEAQVETGSAALAEYEQAQIKARDASASSAAAAKTNAAAMREEAQAAIVAARALSAKRVAEAQGAVVRAQDAAQTAAQREGRQNRSRGEQEIARGARFASDSLYVEQNRAQDRAGQAIREQIRQEQEFARISAGINLGGISGAAGVGSGEAGGGRGGGRSGPSAEDLAAQREMLRLQGELALAQATGREAEARSVQRQIDLINLTKSLTDAGVADAKTAAEAQIAALATAEDVGRELDAAEEAAATRNDRRERSLQYQIDAQRQQNDALLEQIGFEAELARLGGDPVRILAAERDLFIEERINALLRDRVGLISEADKAAARGQAEGEFALLDSADREGRMREEFRASFSDGIKAAIDGDLGGFFENLADRFTSRMLDNLADDLFDLLSQAAKGFSAGGGGGGFLTSIASALSAGFGKRALGGPVSAGTPYIVGERRAEVFVPNVSGTIIPSVNAAMAKAQGAGSRGRVVDYRMTINLAGANGDETIRRIAYDAAARGGQAAYQRARSDVPADLAQKRRYSR